MLVPPQNYTIPSSNLGNRHWCMTKCSFPLLEPVLLVHVKKTYEHLLSYTNFYYTPIVTRNKATEKTEPVKYLQGYSHLETFQLMQHIHPQFQACCDDLSIHTLRHKKEPSFVYLFLSLTALFYLYYMIVRSPLCT